MTQHSELGASICNRWWNCPGSVRLSRGKDNRSSLDARKGTAAHAMAEKCLRDGADAAGFIGSLHDETGETFTADMAESVQTYIDDCRATGDGEVLEVAFEVQFDLSALKPPSPMFGTADFVAYSPKQKKLWVKDYKNGFMHVPATSPQLRYYAIGAALWLGPGKPVHSVEVTVCQPNGSAEAVRTATYTPKELGEWAKELIIRARVTQAPDAPLAAGDWCKFCPVAATCPQRAKEALAVAGVEFGSLVSSTDTPALPEIRLLSTGDLEAIKSRASLFTSWLTDAEAELLRRGIAGDSLRDWKVVGKRPVRSWKNEDHAFDALRLAGIEPYKPAELLSPAQAEAALEPNMPGSTKKGRLEVAKGTLAVLTQSISSGPTLAPASDPRPALPAPGSEFTALPAPETETQG